LDGTLNIAALAALTTALLWAITPLISVAPAAQLGSVGFARWRMYTAFAVLGVIVTLRGGWAGLPGSEMTTLALSGFVGIFLGDTLLFASMNILGPRRAAILFASNAAIAALLAVLFLGETVTFQLFVAFGAVTAGVMLAIFFGKARSNTHLWEMNRGSVMLGIGFGVVAALCQATGSVLAKPVMDTGVEPMTASAFRLGAAAAAHTLFLWILPRFARNSNALDLKTFLQVCATSILSMVVGMTILMFALAKGDVSWVSILSSISPILILPILWIFFSKPPPLGAWVGAALTICGTTLIILNT
jgi:drug/metabolite transporter (DMT)-like permease